MSIQLLRSRALLQRHSWLVSRLSAGRSYKIYNHKKLIRQTYHLPSPNSYPINQRSFHSSRSTHTPLIPIPAMVLAVIKTGNLVSFVSLSSKTSLTLLPHTFRRDRGKLVAKLLASVPILGMTLLLLIGLDQAPNTSRLRFIYLSEEEEEEIVDLEIAQLLEAHYGIVAPKDNEYVQWLQTIADNIAAVAEDDIRSPVRPYLGYAQGETNENGESKRNYDVNIICDSSTMNAMCAGSRVLVYDLMIQYMDYDSTKLAVIISHEIAHSIQRHFVEAHGFASLMFMLGDITRGVFWMLTESLGPYINQKINETISTFITMETQTTYNRVLEKEADLVGLKLLAKAGYDPTVALEVWTKMAELEENLEHQTIKPVTGSTGRHGSIGHIPSTHASQYEDLEMDVHLFVESLIRSWFGSSHPPSQERLEYMKEHMEDAQKLYKDALRINGPAKEYIFRNERRDNPFEDSSELHTGLAAIKQWAYSVFSWSIIPFHLISKT
ncbi:hypothetical protein J3Q64DRAFT_1751039 [Phycomyces blakesleeanus]|uniref:Peptidase M48 domain-containing protein n=2 Tax=Phycomyces blakesleeanus TaxID=4837 RepID=A0A163EF55_PHYB8|nr:hypothetical protein PHYBLDRAFT_69739 [Phycomyces blakesleeanus NRRL 1555(-)]OAD78320.1 hypothetical protein PHYBLDRAFT_69739 [Phycomyces blakesleeanus NRRL 1555(-)]|eukprot:XP_018296360.1 hypothetical protein PHYBLDRAFT_69739 [Phycomyces blakesleeanus NRRL 1555(-)]